MQASQPKCHYEVLCEKYVAIINDPKAWFWSKIWASLKLATVCAIVDQPGPHHLYK